MGTRDEATALAARVQLLLRTHPEYTEIPCTSCHGRGQYPNRDASGPRFGELIDCSRCYAVGWLWFETAEGYERAFSRCAVLDARQMIVRLEGEGADAR